MRELFDKYSTPIASHNPLPQADQRARETTLKNRESKWSKLEEAARKNPLSSQVQLAKPVVYKLEASSELHGPASVEGAPASRVAMRRKSVLPYDPATVQALSDYQGHSLGAN